MVDLLCFSDNHGKAPPVFDESSAAAWLCGGDFYHGPEIDDVADHLHDPARDLLWPAAAWARNRAIPIIFVRGNHDVNDPWAVQASCEDASGRAIRVAEKILVVGVGWCGERHYEIPTESDLLKVCDSARRQVLRLSSSGDRIVMLTHYPPRLPEIFPRGDYEDPGWYECLRLLAEDLKPVAIMQGHNHRWHGISGRITFAGQLCIAAQPGPKGMRVSIDTQTGAAEINSPAD